MEQRFALFIDVMGVQQLTSVSPEDVEAKFAACQEHLADFHSDLASTIERDQLLISLVEPPVSPLSFVAEFSDAAYLVSRSFATVAASGIMMMRRALRHRYPLRGGIGFGSFSHETSGVRAASDNLVWSTSSFLGEAVVTAYQGERCRTPGLRIFVHDAAMQRTYEPLLSTYTMPLPADEVTEECKHELRLWISIEAAAAYEQLMAFRNSQDLTPRARRHYDAAGEAYLRCEAVPGILPAIGPALWL